MMVEINLSVENCIKFSLARKLSLENFPKDKALSVDEYVNLAIKYFNPATAQTLHNLRF